MRYQVEMRIRQASTRREQALSADMEGTDALVDIATKSTSAFPRSEEKT